MKRRNVFFVFDGEVFNTVGDSEEARFFFFFLALLRRLASIDIFSAISSGGWLASMPVVPEKERFDLEKRLCLAILVGIVCSLSVLVLWVSNSTLRAWFRQLVL